MKTPSFTTLILTFMTLTAPSLANVVQLTLSPPEYLSWTNAFNRAKAEGYVLPTQEELMTSGVRPSRGISQDEWHPVRREDGTKNDWVQIGTWSGNSNYISHIDYPSIGYPPEWGLTNTGSSLPYREDEFLYVALASSASS